MATPTRTDYRGPARDAFGKPGIQFPTPNTDDFLVVRQVNKPRGQKWFYPYGTADEVYSGKDGNKLARLVSQSFTNGDNGSLDATYIFATDRLKQGSYGFSTSWAQNSGAHIIVSRSTLVLRSAYFQTASDGTVTVQRTPNFTPDETFPGALMVAESTADAEPPYNTLYLRLTQTFETIAGPILSGEEHTKVGRTVTLIPPEFLGSEKLHVSTQIVVPGTVADVLNSTDAQGRIVLSSIVTALDATHSQKVNISRENIPYPVLTGAEMIDAAGGVSVPVIRQIVAPTAAIPTGFGVLDSSKRALSPDNSLLEVKQVASFPTVAGNEAGRPPENYPGKYGLGDTGGETYREKIIPTGTSWPETVPTGWIELSRDPWPAGNQYMQKVRIGLRGYGNGVTSLSGTGDGRFGPLSLSWNLGVNNAATGSNVIRSSASPAGGAQMEVETVLSTDSVLPVTREAARPNIPGKFLAGVTTATTETPGGPDMVPDAHMLFSVVRPTENWLRAIKESTPHPDYPTLLDLDALSRENGAKVTFTEDVIDLVPGQPVDLTGLDYLVVDATVQNLGGGKGLRRVGRVASWPVLKERQFDERTGNMIDISVTFVDPAEALTGGGAGPDGLVEYLKYDRLKSIKRVTKLDLQTTSREKPITQHYSFPHTLKSFQLVEAWVNASDGSQAWDMGADMNIEEGYSGPCEGTIQERYVLNLNDAQAPQVSKFRPQADTVCAFYEYAGGKTFVARVREIQVPSTLHGSLSFSLTHGQLSKTSLPATSPPALSSGEVICIAKSDPERHLNIWIVRWIEITVP